MSWLRSNHIDRPSSCPQSAILTPFSFTVLRASPVPTVARRQRPTSPPCPPASANSRLLPPWPVPRAPGPPSHRRGIGLRPSDLSSATTIGPLHSRRLGSDDLPSRLRRPRPS